MAAISIPYGFRNVQLAELVAAENGGVVLEQHPAGFVTIEASPRLLIRRETVRRAFGAEVADAAWRSLPARRRGVIATLSSDEIELQDDVLAAGYLLHLPSDLCREAETLAKSSSLTLRDFVIEAIRDKMARMVGT